MQPSNHINWDLSVRYTTSKTFIERQLGREKRKMGSRGRKRERRKGGRSLVRMNS